MVPVVAKITFRFPDHENYEIGRQMRRAVAGIGYNISEVSGKRTSKDYISFLHIAIGSTNELAAQVESDDRLEYFINGDKDFLNKELEEIRKMIFSVIRFVRDKNVR